MAVAAGGYNSLALKSDGTVVAWGDNTYGQSTVPTGLAGVVAIAASGYHSLALQSDGTVVAWGGNSYGQSTVPASVSGASAIAAGDTHSLALIPLPTDTLTAQGSAITPTAEQPFTGTVATFTDTIAATLSSAFSASINWGDGSASGGNVSGSAGSFSVSGTHTYAAPGQYPVTTTISGPGGPAQTMGTANVSPALVTRVLSVQPNPSVYGQSVTATETVTDTVTGLPVTEGTVQFSVGPVGVAGIAVGSPVPLNAQGQAAYTTSSLPAGVTRVTGTYSDTGGQYAGGKNLQYQTVNPANTTLSVSPTPGNPDDTQTVTFQATVGPAAPGAGTPTGSVTFTINGAPQTVPLSSGVATVVAGAFAAGPIPYSAVYNGDTNFITSSSGPQSVTVSPGPATHFSVSAPSTTTAGAAFTVTVTALDAKGATATGYAGTVHFTSSDPQAGLPADATLTNGAGTFSAALNTSGPQTITATDTLSSAVTGFAQVLLPYLAPTASSQSLTTAFNTARAVTLTGTDPNHPAQALTYTVATLPAHGLLSGTAPNLTYTPSAGYHGPDSFTFTVTNTAALTSAPATVSLTVSAGTPTAGSQSLTTAFNTAKAITLTGSDPDVPALPLTYTVATPPAHGALSGTAPNLTYTPTRGYYGPDSFTFTAGNGTNTSAPATVSLTVKPSPLPPTITIAATPSTLMQNSGKMVTVTISGRATDPSAYPLAASGTYSTVDSHGLVQPSGTFSVSAAGAYSFPIALQASRYDTDLKGRTYTVTVHIADAVGNIGTARVVITVPHSQSK